MRSKPWIPTNGRNPGFTPTTGRLRPCVSDGSPPLCRPLPRLKALGRRAAYASSCRAWRRWGRESVPRRDGPESHIRWWLPSKGGLASFDLNSFIKTVILVVFKRGRAPSGLERDFSCFELKVRQNSVFLQANLPAIIRRFDDFL